MSFGTPSIPPAPAPKPLPAAPTLSDTNTAALLEGQKQKKRRGYQSTILTGTLGDSSSSAPVSTKRLLGE